MNMLWQECADCLRTELTPQQYDTWIMPLIAEEDATVLRLYAPNRFFAQWVQHKFQGRIQEILEQHCAEPPQIILLAYDSADPKLAPVQISAPKAANANSLMAPGGVPPQSSNQAKEPPSNQASKQSITVPLASTTRGSGSPRAIVGSEPSNKLPHQGRIRPQFNFANFIEGKSNRMALAAAQSVAENPCSDYNPLYIYGGVGLGKTHLLQAIGNQIKENYPDANVVYLGAERFINTMLGALRVKAMPDFKRFYRAVDVLLIDDVHMFGGKVRSEEELLHTFNALMEDGRQLVLAGGSHPKSIDKLDECLASRLCSGLLVAVDPPEQETRTAILMKKAEAWGLPLPMDAATYIAGRLKGNVRDLEGALKRLMVYHGSGAGGETASTSGDITITEAKKVLRPLFVEQDKRVSLDNIQRVVADYYQIKMADMKSSRRTQSIARPRQMAMYLARGLTEHSLPEIGEAFGGRHHTSVLHACKRIEELLQEDTQTEEDYRKLRCKLAS